MARFFGIRPALFLGPVLLMALFGDFTLASEKNSKARQKRSPVDYPSGSGAPPYSGSGSSGYPPYSGSGSSGYPPYSGSGSSGYPPYSGSGGGGGCECKPRPDDCTRDDKPTKPGKPACTCTPDIHPDGCTLQPCKASDNGSNRGYDCICSAASNNGNKCFAPSQTIFSTGSMDVLGLATLFGIKPEADHQLAAGLMGTQLLGDKDNSQLSVMALDTLLGGASPQSSPLSGLLGGGLLPARK